MDHPLPFRDAEAALHAFDALKEAVYSEQVKAAFVVADTFLACVPVATTGHDTPREVIASHLLADLVRAPGAPRPSQWLRDVLASPEYREKQQFKADTLARLFVLKDAFSST